ncbi:lipase 3-like [Scylla paramamosain]
MNAVVDAVVVMMVVVMTGAPVSSSPRQGHHQHLPRNTHWTFNLTTPEIVQGMGYPAEVHHVTTSDGYLLELHRIPHGAAGPSEGRLPVLLQHGILGSSADWVLNTADQALAFLLADAGYDVWLSNTRGNTYCRRHQDLSPDQQAFWSFSWDEMAYYDLPASIDYILEVTGAADLHYVGYSMGTTIFFAMMSERPEYNEKVRVMAALAPVAFVDHIKSPLRELAPYSNDIDTVLTLLGVGELLPGTTVMDYLAENFCDADIPLVDVCYNIFFLIVGPDTSELNKDYMTSIVSHTPAGTSVHTANHYGQEVLSGNFIKYDYGLLGNLNHYGQQTPPHYDLAKVTTPVGLFHSDNDWLAAPEDVARLQQLLPNVVFSHRVDFHDFNHADFVWAVHARQYVHRYVLELLAQY